MWYKQISKTLKFTGLGIRSSNFGANRSFFAKKVSKWAICSKSEWFAHLLIFWLETWAICSRSLIPSERPEQIACGRSFVLSNLSDSLTSLRRNEQIFCFLKNTVKNVQKIWFKNFFFEPIAYFLWAKDKSDRFAQKTDQFTHLSWVTWANRSHSLICHERHLSWAI